MARLPEVRREDLSTENQAIYDEIAESRGTVRGPYTMLIHSPKLAARMAATGDYVRFSSGFSKALRGVAILATAREISNQYEFTAHAGLARQAGVTESTMDALKDGNSTENTSPDEAKVMNFVRDLLRDRRVSDATFDAVKDRFGVQRTVDLTGIIGHYLSVGQVINAFELQLAEGVAPELPV